MIIGRHDVHQARYDGCDVREREREALEDDARLSSPHLILLRGANQRPPRSSHHARRRRDLQCYGADHRRRFCAPGSGRVGDVGGNAPPSRPHCAFRRIDARRGGTRVVSKRRGCPVVAAAAASSYKRDASIIAPKRQP